MTSFSLALLRTLVPHKTRLLQGCVAKGDLTGASAWLRAGANPDHPLRGSVARVGRCATLLHLAVSQENADMVDLLLAYGAHTRSPGAGQIGAFSLWGSTLARTPEPSVSLRRIGVSLLGAGADFQQELAPPSGVMVFDALTVNGKIAFLESVVGEHEAKAAHTHA